MSQVQEIKDRIVISEIVGQRVKLQNAGAYQKGLCPFHHEHTPSFFVNDALGYYKCFGCGESGDVYTFLEKYEHMTFREALEYLAAQAGVVLTNYKPTAQDQKRQQVLEALSLAADYYASKLSTAVGTQASAYLRQRGTTSSTIKLFQLGAAGTSWEDLTHYLRQKGFKDDILTASGLARTNSSGRLYDNFHHRLLFPLKNHRGQVVGFSGRLLEDNDNEPKYINTPETIVYHKKQMLYGLHELSAQIRKAKQMLIVEGEFDVLSSVQAGVDWAVAIKGSALTAEHAELIARYTDRVLLALDADAAGIKATRKAIASLRPLSVELRVVMLTPGSDPDEMARRDPAAWRQQVKQAVSVYDFFLQATLSQHDVHHIDEQKKVLQELAPIFDDIDNRLEYEHYLRQLSERLSQDPEIVRADLIRWRDFGQIQVPATSPPPAQKKPRRQLTKLQKLDAYLWFLFLQCLSTQTEVAAASQYIVATDWQNPFLLQLAQAYQNYYQQHPQPTLSGFHQSLPADFQEKISQLSLNQNFIKYASKTDLAQEWHKQQQVHQRENHKRQVQVLTQELATLENITEPTLAQEKRKNDILQTIKNLQTGNNTQS